MRLLLLLCMLSTGGIAMAAEYFVAPDGRADNPGTLKAPWSLAQANAAAKPGDVITFLSGDYEGVIEPAASGEEGKPSPSAARSRWRRGWWAERPATDSRCACA